MNRAYTVTRAVALLAVVVASFVDMRAQGRALPGGGSPATLTIDRAVREAVDHNLTLLPERFNVKRRGRRPDHDDTAAQSLRVSGMGRDPMPRLLVAGLVIVGAMLNESLDGAPQRARDGTRVTSQSPYDGAFRFCRIRFRSSPAGDGDGWFVDYPRADENLSRRLSELTKTHVPVDAYGNPHHVVVTLTDPELFLCPFVMMTEPGGADFDDEEAAQLRTYLLKGGFLWADDFWGTRAWKWWAHQIGKALPPEEFPIVELPLDHPLYHMMFDIKEVPQIPNIGLWLRRHITSERGADSAKAEPRAILDHAGRVIVYMTHNTDFGDGYEQESVSPDYFRRFSVQAYAIGIDVLLYAMTH